MNQKVFAEMLGVGHRTYQGRLDRSQPKWSFQEIAKVCELNNGKVRVDTSEGSYEVSIKKVK